MLSGLFCVCCAAIVHASAATLFVSSQALQSLITTDNLVAGAEKLQGLAYSYPERNRVFGGPAHNDTVNWLYATLKDTGYYNVSLQPFVELFSGGNASLTIDDESQPVGLFTYTPSGSVSAPLMFVANLGCNNADFSSDIAGRIALISRGTCSFAVKASNALSAGAAAAVIYDNVVSEIPATGTLGGAGNYVPVVGITKSAGEALVRRTRIGTVTASVEVNSILENRTTYNVIAETKSGDHNNVISLGGHSDSVEAGPGINDDGSGIIGILEVAKALTQFKVKNAVRFFFWSAEEFGLLGSEYYITQLNESATELAKIRAYLNFDMIASPNYILGIYDGDGSAFNLSGPPGSAQIEAGFERFYKSKGNNSVPTEFSGRSDYGPFLDVGIPAGGLSTGAEVPKKEAEIILFGGEAGVANDDNYHKEGDTVNNLNLEAFFLNTQAIADSVAMYAMDLDSIPMRNMTLAKREGAATRETRKQMRRLKSRGILSHGHACDYAHPTAS